MMKYLLITLLGLQFCVQIKSEDNGKIYLCCEPTEYFNRETSRCENLVSNVNTVSWEVTYPGTNDDDAVPVNILEDRRYEVRPISCKNPRIYVEIINGTDDVSQ